MKTAQWSRYTFEINASDLVSQFCQTIPVVVEAVQSADPAKIQLAMIPLVSVVSCVSISPTRGRLLEEYIRKTIARTLQEVFKLIPHKKIGYFKRFSLNKELKPTNVEIDVDLGFLIRPGSSIISIKYLEHFCSVLANIDVDLDHEIQQIKIAWPRYFTQAARDEWTSKKEYYDELSNDSIFGPMQPYLDAIGAESKYKQQLCLKLTEGLFDGSCCIEDIYVDLVAEQRSVSSESDESSPCWIEDELISWAINGAPGLVVVAGDPGSGKSTVLKKVAKELICNGMHVVYLDLHRLPFSTRTSCLDTIKLYIKELSWYAPLNIGAEPDTIYIMDGLDEIRNDVWGNARDLTSQLPLSTFCTNQKVILSGRKKIIEYCSNELGMANHYNILPLVKKQPQIDQRAVLWDKLARHYQLSITIDELLKHDHLKELSENPLLLFLLAWTFKQDPSSLDKINNSVQLYRHILKCVYFRSHDRGPGQKIDNGYISYFNILRAVGACAWLHNSRAIEITKIREYCESMKITKAYEKWFEEEKSEKTSSLFLLFFAHEGKTQEDESIFEFLHKSFYEYLALEELVHHINLLGILPVDDAIKRLWYLLSRQMTDSDSIFDFLEDLITESPQKFSVFTENLQKAFTLTQAADIRLTTLQEPPLNSIFDKLTIKDTIDKLDCLRKNLWRLVGYVFTTTEKNLSLGEVNLFSFAEMHFDAHRIHVLRIVDADFSRCVFNDITMPLTQMLQCTWSQVGFYNCVFSGSEFEEGRFEGARVLGSNFEAVSFQKAIIYQSEFDCNRFEGSYFCESTVQESNFTDCHFERANLDDAVFELCTFSDCNFDSADFSGAAFHNCTFIDCSFDGSLMSGVKLADLDWSDESLIDALSNAELDDADWDGITEVMRKKLHCENANL